MALEISGKLFQLLAEQSGSGKNGTWIKRDFVIETAENFPKKICLSAWAEKATEVANLSIGTELRVSFDVNSREYNGKWYTDLKAWKIDVLSGGSAPSQGAPSGGNEPFGVSFSEEEDSLPF